MTIAKSVAFIAAAGTLALAAPAQATDVVFTGVLVNSCVLTVATHGVLNPAPDGVTLTSETPGGVPALLNLVAVGTGPTLTFGAPTVQGPAGMTGTPTTAIRYVSLRGASQAYTSGSSTSVTGALIDSYTVHAKVQNNDGYPSGTYSVRTVVTCEQ